MPSRLDFTICIPDSYLKQIQDPIVALKWKVGRVPKENLDKLYPGKTGFVEYVDEGLWRTRIDFQKGPGHAPQGEPHPSLDHLCEEELQRRYPGYQVITGLPAFLKDKFPNLARLVMGTDAFFKNFTAKEIQRFKKHIAHSATNREDMICCPKIEDPTLRKELNLTSDDTLRTDHLFAKNSPVNGQSYMHKGKPVHLFQAIACSSDRHVENTGNLRVIQAKDGRSICYAGRVDSAKKVLEQASFIFFHELKTKRKGVTQEADGTYTLDYVVNSMLSIPFFWGTESFIAPFPERQYLEEERKALFALRDKGVVTLKRDGIEYRVKFNPLLFTRSSNLFARLEPFLPSILTGQARSEEISAEGFEGMKALAEKKQDPKIQALLKALEGPLSPEAEWITRDYLCKLLDIPFVYHCKSSTDRTSITVAMSSALNQWLALNLPVPENIASLIEDYRFKELFAANWMAGHQMTRYARGAKGILSGKKLNNKNLGLALSRGFAQNPLVATLVPERYLTGKALNEDSPQVGHRQLIGKGDDKR